MFYILSFLCKIFYCMDEKTKKTSVLSSHPYNKYEDHQNHGLSYDDDSQPEEVPGGRAIRDAPLLTVKYECEQPQHVGEEMDQTNPKETEYQTEKYENDVRNFFTFDTEHCNGNLKRPLSFYQDLTSKNEANDSPLGQEYIENPEKKLKVRNDDKNQACLTDEATSGIKMQENESAQCVIEKDHKESQSYDNNIMHASCDEERSNDDPYNKLLQELDSYRWIPSDFFPPPPPGTAGKKVSIKDLIPLNKIDKAIAFLDIVAFKKESCVTDNNSVENQPQCPETPSGQQYLSFEEDINVSNEIDGA